MCGIIQDRNVSVLTRLSAEIRLCEKQIVVLVARVNPGPGPVKSERHVPGCPVPVGR